MIYIIIVLVVITIMHDISIWRLHKTQRMMQEWVSDTLRAIEEFVPEQTEPQTDIHDLTDCDFCKDRNCKDCEGGKDEPTPQEYEKWLFKEPQMPSDDDETIQAIAHLQNVGWLQEHDRALTEPQNDVSCFTCIHDDTGHIECQSCDDNYSSYEPKDEPQFDVVVQRATDGKRGRVDDI